MPKFAVAIHDLALETHQIYVISDDNPDSAIVVAVSNYLRKLPPAEFFDAEEAIRELTSRPLKALLTELELSAAVLEI